MKHPVLSRKPLVDKNAKLEEKTILEFNKVLEEDLFLNQGKDNRDQGSDLQIELLEEESKATNFRINIQLKGTKTKYENSILKRTIKVENLIYLLSGYSSIYICFNESTKQLMVITAEEVLQQQIERKVNIAKQKTITINFKDNFDKNYQKDLHKKILNLKNIEKENNYDLLTNTEDYLYKYILENKNFPIINYKEKTVKNIVIKLHQESYDEIIKKNYDLLTRTFDENNTENEDLYIIIYNAYINCIGKEKNNDVLKKCLNFLINLKTTKFDIRFQLATTYQLLDYKKEAIDIYKELINIKEHRFYNESLQHLVSLEENNDLKKKYLIDSLKNNEYFNESNFSYGILLYEEENYKDCINYLNKIHFTKKNIAKQIDLHYFKSICYFNLKQYESAINELIYLLPENNFTFYERYKNIIRNYIGLIPTNLLDNLLGSLKNIEIYNKDPDLYSFIAFINYKKFKNGLNYNSNDIINNFYEIIKYKREEDFTPQDIDGIFWCKEIYNQNYN